MSKISTGHQYDIHDFLNVLINLSRLETLQIVNVLHNKSTRISLPTVSLRRLQNLTIISGRDIISSFLTRLRAVPPTLRMKLWVFSHMKTSWHISYDLLPPLRTRFHYIGNGRLARSRIKAVVVDVKPITCGITHMYGYDHTDISRISSYTLESAQIEEENTGLLFDFVFVTYKGKNRNGVSRRIFRALMPDAEVLEVRAGFGNESTGPTVWWWKMALRSLASLEVVYLSADAQTCANFCEALRSLIQCRPRDFPRLRTLYVHKYSQTDIDRDVEWRSRANPSNSEDYDPLDVPRTNFQHLLDLARAYVEAGHSTFGMMMTGDNSDFEYWPGADKLREISSLTI
ncbi:hypothetical protein BDZ89DRAFT_555246 [Hymenopellis radicata]|nr:hypothetical protein BDZ89DRAFT_555246 [Hymenopellis radicata]